MLPLSCVVLFRFRFFFVLIFFVPLYSPRFVFLPCVSFWFVSSTIDSFHLVLFHFASFSFVLMPSASLRFDSLSFALFRIIDLLRSVPFRFVSVRPVQLPFLFLFYFVTLPFVSFRFVLSRFDSFPFVSPRSASFCFLPTCFTYFRFFLSFCLVSPVSSPLLSRRKRS